MTSTERREGRYQRRKAQRDAAKEEKLGKYDDFERVADVDNLYYAFTRCMRGVSWKESVQRYEANALKNVYETSQKLRLGQSVQSAFVAFTLRERGKTRLIKSIHISERVVQKCLCDQVLVPILSNCLIHDNGASVKGKGVHFALRRLIAHLAKFYRHNKSNQGYALQIDFTKFFDSVDHKVLYSLLGRKIKDPRVRSLIKNFVGVFGDGKSLGLGSQISQICAIYYPDRLDHYIKEKLRIKYYGRYMDDLYLIHEDKAYLEHCLKVIEGLCEKLKITVNMKKTRIVKLEQGVVFLKGKYHLLPSGKILMRPMKDSTKRMRRKLIKFRRLFDQGKMSYQDLRTAYQSWRGNYKRRFKAYRRLRYMDKLYNELFLSHTNVEQSNPGVAGKN